MSTVSTASIHRAYNPNRRPGQNWADRPATDDPIQWRPYPQQPTYPTYPQYPGYPQQPQYPGYPQQPQYPGYPQQPQYPGYPYQPRTNFLGDVWGGVKERSHEIGQFVLHPFNAYARRPYMGRNPYAPRTPGETTGRWLVNGVLIVGAFLGGRALLGGGGGAGVGMSGALGKVVEVVATPFKWAARGIGAVLGGVKDMIGGVLSGLFGGARVGFR